MVEGVKHDKGKLRMDLLAPEGIEGIATILTFGAGKYGDRNWEKGMSWSRVFGALLRHLYSWWKGQDTDPETGESHLHHAACNIHFLQTYEARKIGIDDRPKTKIQPPVEDDWKDCGKNVNSIDGEPRRSMRDTFDPFFQGIADSTGTP